MSTIADNRDAVCSLSSAMAAAVLLTACAVARRFGLAHPSVEQVLEATQAGKSRAFELRARLLGWLVAGQRAAGRPRVERPAEPAEGLAAELTDATLAFVVGHPGCAHCGPGRGHYAEAFRHFVMELREQHPELELERFAAAVQVPLGTVKDWLSGGYRGLRERERRLGHETGGEQGAGRGDGGGTGAWVETVLSEWSSWCGSFVEFCNHLQRDWRVPFGRSIVRDILHAEGLRIPQRRQGRSPDEQALRGSYETFFAGAQWGADGSPMTVTINGQPFTFNFELMTDTYSGAFVGQSVRDEEDGRAVVAAFEQGVATTGAPPLALVMDNRPSNHTEQVDEAIGQTIRLRTTKGRPQNNAHTEGGFGLFNQQVPPLVINASTPGEMALQVLKLVGQTWRAASNQRPRKDRGGRSRAELYAEKPSEEQIAHARASFEERWRKQQKARETAEARQDPEVRRLLDKNFAELGLLDPERHVRNAIARYPLNAIIDGIATFIGKLNAGTLPDDLHEDMHGRYLLGIVRNIAENDEGLWITETLIQQRTDVGDSMLLGLRRDLETAYATATNPSQLISSLLVSAVATERRIDRLFWLNATADAIRAQPLDRHQNLCRRAAQRIHSAFHLAGRDRQESVRIIISKVFSID